MTTLDLCGCTCGKTGCFVNTKFVCTYKKGCRCEKCKGSEYEHSTIGAARRNAKSKDKAVKHGQRWTDSELEIALNKSYSQTEAAEILGRTVFAVKTMRRKCGND